MGSLSKTDMKLIRESFKIKHCITAIIILSAIFIFLTPLQLGTKNILIEPILSKVPQTLLTSLIFFILFILAIARCIFQFKKSLLPTSKSVIVSITLLLIYHFFIRNTVNYHFYPKYFLTLTWLKYLDFFAYSLALIILDFRSFKKQSISPHSSSFIEDQPNPTNYTDLFSRHSYATEIVNRINSTSTENAFSIGIFGEWGSGKTDFLIRMKNLLINEKNNLIIEFNPWKISGKKSMIIDFFNSLADKLKPYNNSINERVHAYSKKITEVKDSVPLKIIDFFIGEIISDNPASQDYDYINNSIKQTGKRLVVLIDDLDRLTGKEIFEVLRLIRNTANFSNSVFITACDPEYIVKALKKTKAISLEEQYLLKIFQLVITLPQITKRDFQNQIKTYLNFGLMNSLDQEQINRILSFGIADIFENIRDVKRFCNSFSISFNQLKEEVEVLDLAYLEVIKCKWIDVYQRISSKQFIDSKDFDNKTYSFNKEEWDTYASATRAWPSSITAEIKDIILKLITSVSYKNSRAFSHPKNFYLYFTYQLFDLVSLKEFNALMNGDSTELKNKLVSWATKSPADINTLLDNYSGIDSKEKFINIINVYLSIDDFYISRAILSLKMHKQMYPNIFESDSEFLIYLNNLFKDSSLPYLNRALVAKEFLTPYVYNNAQSDFNNPYSKEEIQKILLWLFDGFLNSHKGYDTAVSSLFYLNDDSRIENKWVVLNKDAGFLLKGYLLMSEENFEGYIKYFIRSYSVPNDGFFVFDPYVTQIFDSANEFKALLVNLETTDENVIKLRKIILAQQDKSFYKEENKFYLEEEDYDFVSQHLINMGLMYKDFLIKKSRKYNP